MGSTSVDHVGVTVEMSCGAASTASAALGQMIAEIARREDQDGEVTQDVLGKLVEARVALSNAASRLKAMVVLDDATI